MEELKKTFAGYEEFKQTLDTELTRTTEGFVRIGFLLKTARDNPAILAGSGYANINDMAAAEYNIDKTMVSRFISINDRFSEGGNSDRLQDKYRGYGYAKLAIMLQLPDGINDEISPEYSKSEINTIKKEYDAEQQVTPLEVLAEPKDATADTLTQTEQVFYVVMHNEPELYRQLWESITEWKKYLDILAPAGEAVYIARVSGAGKFMVSVKADGITVVNMRDASDREQMSGEGFIQLCGKLFAHDEPTVESKWKALFREDMPETAKVAPVQQDKKPVVKKPKVTVAKREKSQKKGPDKQTAPHEEEQLKGQMNVEDYPGVVHEENRDDKDKGGLPDAAGDGIHQNRLRIAYRPLQGTWYPVKSKIPDDDRYILISDASRAVLIIGRYDAAHDEFISDSGHCHYVEAWMELPEPYEKG